MWRRLPFPFRGTRNKFECWNFRIPFGEKDLRGADAHLAQDSGHGRRWHDLDELTLATLAPGARTAFVAKPMQSVAKRRVAYPLALTVLALILVALVERLGDPFPVILAHPWAMLMAAHGPEYRQRLRYWAEVAG